MTRIETLVIIHQPPRILLGFKNPEKKYGEKWNGFGGGVESKENLKECAKRETYQETGILVKDLEKKGEILFTFQSKEPNHQVYIYKSERYTGKLTSTKDFSLYAFFDENSIPLEEMMPADKYWFPFFVKDKMFKGLVKLDKRNGEYVVISHEINEVDNLD